MFGSSALARPFLGAFVAVLFAAGLAAAATVPSGFTETVLTNALSSPTSMTLAPDGRIFVCRQGVALRVIKNGALVATPFVTVTTTT